MAGLIPAVGDRGGSGAGNVMRRPSGEGLEDVDEGDDPNTDGTFQAEGEGARKRSESMLSDLDALQREIDALQEKYRKAS